MKKEMIIIFAVLACFLSVCIGCGSKGNTPVNSGSFGERQKEPEKESKIEKQDDNFAERESEMFKKNTGSKIAPGRELMALVDSGEEAAEIAAEYDIKLVSYGTGVAVYSVGEKKLSDILAQEKDSNRNRLYVNYIRSLQ